jgi:sulfur carrier protein
MTAPGREVDILRSPAWPRRIPRGEGGPPEYSGSDARDRLRRSEDFEAVTIQLNGERYEVPEPLTVDALLARLDIDGRRVAVEVNEFVVKKAAYAETLVQDGDAVEVVNFVGGG